jgi:hypothetical protein
MPTETTWLDIVTRYLLPPILGGAGGLIGAWAGWGIEKQKQRLQRRRELITGWRMELLPLIAQPGDLPEIWAGQRQREVMASPYYASLRPHLSDAAVAQIEDSMPRLFVNMGRSVPPAGPKNDWNRQFPLKLFVDEIARIEREWRLV